MVTEKQAYEWVKTGHWSLADFKAWMVEVREEIRESTKSIYECRAEDDAYDRLKMSGHG